MAKENLTFGEETISPSPSEKNHLTSRRSMEIIFLGSELDFDKREFDVPLEFQK